MRELEKRLLRAKAELDLKPGDIYEDCAYHPVLCIGVDYTEGDIWGISLIDGSQPRSCGILHCGIRKLTLAQAWSIKLNGPEDPEVRNQIKNKWWKVSECSD